jgi:hypothetical protein
MSEQNIYCGSGKATQYDGVVLTICLDDIAEEHTYLDKNGKRMVKLLSGKRREVSQYGQTHFVRVLPQDESYRKPKQNDDDFTKTKTSPPDDQEPPF